MDHRVILSQPSQRDLGRVARYIAQGNPAVERVGLKRMSVAESLHVLPRRGARLRSPAGLSLR
jgi:plasmid stabilization system protein ParE